MKRKDLIILVVMLLGAIGFAVNYYKSRPKNVVISELFTANREETDEKEALSVINTMRNALDEVSKVTEDICLAWFYEHNIENSVAISVCKCERAEIDKKFSMDDILYFQDNLNRWNFLIYKKEERAMKIDKALVDVRKSCIEKVKMSLIN